MPAFQKTVFRNDEMVKKLVLVIRVRGKKVKKLVTEELLYGSGKFRIVM